MKTTETIPGRGKERIKENEDRGGEFNYDIFDIL
jgi:hypothetical protein